MRVFGYPVVVVNTPDAAKFILTPPSRHMFAENYPDVFLKVIFSTPRLAKSKMRRKNTHAG